MTGAPAPSPSGDPHDRHPPMTWQLVVGSLTGVAALIGAIIGAVKWATDTAIAGLERLVSIQRAELDEVKREVAALRDHDRRHAAALQAHAQWDARVSGVLTPEQVAALGPPPPLYPPEEA